MKVSLEVTSHGPDDATHTQILEMEVPEPGAGSARDWADDHLASEVPLVYIGQLGQSIAVLACPDRPDLVGSQFDWWWD